MKAIKLIALGMLAAACNCWAQDGNQPFTITGQMTRDSLRFKPQAIRKLYLKRTIDGVETTVDSATVQNKQFTFKGTAPKYAEVAFISGFDNGSIQVFLEPGNITIAPFDSQFPAGAVASGTHNNDVMREYQRMTQRSIGEARQRMQRAMDSIPAGSSEETAYSYQYAAYHSNSLYQKIDIMRFVRQHLDDEASLYIIQHSLAPMFTAKVMERQWLRAIPARLHDHPVYLAMVNQVKADNLKEGAPAPDIEGFTPDGKRMKLSDLKGKYVLLDFWASWCGPCRREFPYIKQALAASEANDKFVVLSYSIDDKKKDWTDCIAKNGLTHKNWLHISTLKGWSSDAVTLFAVKAVPRTVLLNPRGEVIAFELRGEEMLKKVKAIIDGTEKYE